MLPDIAVRASVERLPVLVGLFYGLQVVQLRGVPKLVNGMREKQLAMLLLQLSKSGGLKIWLMSCALIPLHSILADEVELVV